MSCALSISSLVSAVGSSTLSTTLSTTLSVTLSTTLSDSQLDDIGLSRASFVSEIVNSVRKDLDNAENNKSKREMIAVLINPNLAGSV